MPQSEVIFRILRLIENNPEDGTLARVVYLGCPNLETEEQHALDIITARFGQPHPLYSITKPEAPPEYPLTRGEVDNLTGKEKVNAIKESNEAAEAKSNYINELREWEAIHQCIIEKDKKLAHQILHHRRGKPGEKFDFILIYDRYSTPEE